MPRPRSLAEVGVQARAGLDWRVAVRELLDHYGTLTSTDDRQEVIDSEPPRFDAVGDAYLAALAEHLAFHDGLARPRWCVAPDRFLDRMWFASTAKDLRASAIQQSPASFRRRGLFIGATTLARPPRAD